MPKKTRSDTGPRGGTTTRTDSGMVKKNFWIHAEDAERLRVFAFELRTTEAELIRQAITDGLDELAKQCES